MIRFILILLVVWFVYLTLKKAFVGMVESNQQIQHARARQRYYRSATARQRAWNEAYGDRFRRRSDDYVAPGVRRDAKGHVIDGHAKEV